MWNLIYLYECIISLFKSLIYWYHKTSRTGLVTMTIQQYVVICCLGWFWKVTMAFHSHYFYLTPIKHTTYQFSHSLSKCCFQMWSWWNSKKMTRKRNATNIFPQHFVSRANINDIFIYMYGTLYTLYTPLNILHSIHHFRSSKQRSKKCLCSSCCLTMR